MYSREPFYFATEVAQNSSKSFSTQGTASHCHIHLNVLTSMLAQAICGFLVQSARLLHVSSTPNMNHQTRRLTKQMEASFPSNMGLDQWKALFPVTYLISAIFPLRNRILQRLSKNQASHLLSESRSRPTNNNSMYLSLLSWITDLMAFLVLDMIPYLSIISPLLSTT